MDDHQKLAKELSVEIAEAVHEISAVTAPTDSVERVIGNALEIPTIVGNNPSDNLGNTVVVPSSLIRRRRIPVALVCSASITALALAIAFVFLSRPVLNFMNFNKFMSLQRQLNEGAISEVEARAGFLQVASSEEDAALKLRAAFQVANRWPTSIEAESGRRIAHATAQEMSIDDLADCLDSGRPCSGQVKYWQRFADLLHQLIENEPEHPRAGRLLSALAIIYRPDTGAESATNEFREVAELIRTRYASSRDLANFCEILEIRSEAAAWTFEFERHLRDILSSNSDRFVCVSAHYALASLVRAGGDERTDEARKLHEEFLAQYDGKTEYHAQGIELHYRRNIEELLKKQPAYRF